MSKAIPLTDAPRALAALGVSASYVAIWRRVIAGSIPAHRIKSRWYVNAADLPAVAEALRK